MGDVKKWSLVNWIISCFIPLSRELAANHELTMVIENISSKTIGTKLMRSTLQIEKDTCDIWKKCLFRRIRIQYLP